MNIIIIEDDPNKLRQLEELVRFQLPQAEIASRRSYQSGLREVLRGLADFVVLDMTMPTYDVSPTEKGGRTRVYAGREILREISRRKIAARVIVVTQFETFGEGALKKTLAELRGELMRDFPGTYVDSVFYHPAQTAWRDRLAELCAELGEGVKRADQDSSD